MNQEVLEILDSGARQSKIFGRYDLLTYSAVSKLLYLNSYKYNELILHIMLVASNCESNPNIDTADKSSVVNTCLRKLFQLVTTEVLGEASDIIDGLGIVAQVMEEGEKKYGAFNWQGIPIKSQLNHIVFHYLKHIKGDTSEPHLEHILCRCFFVLSLLES